MLIKLEWGETFTTRCVKSAGAEQTAAEVLFYPITHEWKGGRMAAKNRNKKNCDTNVTADSHSTLITSISLLTWVKLDITQVKDSFILDV